MVALIAVLAVCVAVGVFFLLKTKDTATATPLPTPVLPTTWVFQHSVGMPAGPTPEGEGFVFDFPSVGSVHYLVKAAPGGGSLMQAEIEVQAESADFNYKLKPDNTCEVPASTRLYFQRLGDNVSGQGPYEFYRWWSVEESGAFTLKNGSASLSCLLTPDKWVSVFGRKGDSSPEATAGFHAAVSQMGAMGLTFGGGCFYGHGVNVPSGTARFTLKSFTIQ